MALIKCEDCGKEISDKAPACPQCGSPQAAGQTTTATAPPPKTEAAKETVYHKKDTNNVEVTSTRFIAGGKTYPINGITSVGVVKVGSSRTGPLLIFLLGVLCFAGTNAHIGWPIGGGIIIGLSIWWFITIKDKWAVSVVTAAGQVKALIIPHRKGKGKPYIEKVAAAINKAIAHRG